MITTNIVRLMLAAAMLLSPAVAASALNLPFGLGSDAETPFREARPAPEAADRPVLLAQSGDPAQRINQLEEDNRRLNGRLEELSFQLLQMQEQLRKQQEDIEFRFQELEGGASARSGGDQRTELSTPPPAGGKSEGGATAPSIDTPSPDAARTASAPADAPGGDQIGDLLGSGDTGGLGAPPATAAPPATPGNSATVAAVTPRGAGELYDLAYNYLLAGDYQLAENSFRQYAQTYPDAGDVPDANYWLGESLFAQAKYTEAAEVFLNAQKDHPQSGKAPEMMLKLGMSLAKLDNRETACVTFKEVARRYPDMSANVKRKLGTESKSANC